jgi:hypothetical protein
MAHTCRIDGTPVVLGKGGKLLVDDRLVAVVAYNGRFQVVRDYGQRSTAIEVERIFTGLDQVALLLRLDGFTIRVVAAGQDGNEDLHSADFACLRVNHFQFVTGKVDVHLIACIVLHMSDDTGAEHILPEILAEACVSITVRMLPLVFFIERLHGHALAFEACRIIGQQGFKLCLTP